MSSPIGGLGPQSTPIQNGKTNSYRFVEDGVRVPSDSVQLSSEFMRLRGVDGNIRLDKVMEVKNAIAEGKVYTPEAFSRAVNRALDEIFAE